MEGLNNHQGEERQKLFVGMHVLWKGRALARKPLKKYFSQKINHAFEFEVQKKRTWLYSG